MIKYVLGFCFSADESRVVLIRKNRPKWQAGLLNGVGGKVESGETPEEAMIREFQEETGVLVYHWTPFTTMTGPHKHDRDPWEVSCFYSYISYEMLHDVKTMTTEEVNIFPVTHIHPGQTDPHQPNLTWLIPLALNFGEIDYKIHIPE